MSTSAPPAADSPPVAQAVSSKQELKQLIAQAAGGDRERIERLIRPFLTPDERLIWCGLTAKLGLIPTYDFAFITDRRIGDLEVTPLTGNLHVEMSYLQHIDAYVMIQPAFPLWMWGLLGGMYPFAALAVWLVSRILPMLMHEMGFYFSFWFLLATVFRLGLVVAGLAAVYFVINPAIIRLFLRLKKSGLWLKLRGTVAGARIFADRDRFGVLANMARIVTEQKRVLDAETA
jgi:hypothetical protein